MTDDYFEDCDAYTHELFLSAGMFCPCTPDQDIAAYFAYIQGFQRRYIIGANEDDVVRYQVTQQGRPDPFDGPGWAALTAANEIPPRNPPVKAQVGNAHSGGQTNPPTLSPAKYRIRRCCRFCRNWDVLNPNGYVIHRTNTQQDCFRWLYLYFIARDAGFSR